MKEEDGLKETLINSNDYIKSEEIPKIHGTICKFDKFYCPNIGTGFYLKIPYKEKYIKALLTCNHVLKIGKNISTIYYYQGNNRKNLDLKGRKKWQSESNNLDYTCIQILEKDNIKNFLEIDKNILNGNYFSLKKNLLIQIYDFQLKLSVGNIEPKTYKNDKEENYIYYSCNTQAGWSGGPILTCDNLLIGVHNAGCSKTNKGINIKCIINDIIKKIQKDKNKES